MRRVKGEGRKKTRDEGCRLDKEGKVRRVKGEGRRMEKRERRQEKGDADVRRRGEGRRLKRGQRRHTVHFYP